MDFNPRSPHGERQSIMASWSWYANFNPRSPHGERLVLRLGVPSYIAFQSTLPARGATAKAAVVSRASMISIHAPRTGSDGIIHWFLPPLCNFNPRSPHGERLTFSTKYERPNNDFNPRSPHGERLRKVTILSIRIIGFAQKVYHKTVLLRISLAENAVILPKRPRNPVRTSLQKAGGLRFARAIRAARPYSISSPSGA